MAVGGYSAGNLEFEIQAMSKNTTASLSKMNKGLKTSALSITDIVNKVYFLRNYTKQLFRDMRGILQKAVDYTETLNLWQVAMRGNREEAEEFVKTMNRAYGISTQTLMNYQAIFKNMLSSLGGISGNVSYALSEYLTQMALDYASLYNTSIEKAMTTFQSVLSGQVRPIRSIAGYDITETTIYQLYQQLGGTKTMRQLTQTEKRLLRIYAVFQQMESSGAVGDLGKTMESTANQMRVLIEGLKELGTWIGIVFEDILRPALPYVNAFVITLTNIVKAIAQMRGAKPQEFGMVEALEEANEEAKELTGSLLEFDKFSALSTGQQETNMFGIDQTLLDAMTKFDSILDNVNGKAQELAESWTKWWVTEDGNLTTNAQDLLNTLEDIGITLGIIVAYKMGSKVLGFIGRVLELNSALGLLNKVIGLGIVVSLYKMIEAFREGNNTMGIVYAVIMGSLVVAYAVLNAYKIRNILRTKQETSAEVQRALTLQALTLQITMQLDAILLKLGASAKELDMIYALSQAETQNTAIRNKSTQAIKKQAGAWNVALKSVAGFAAGLSIGLAILQLVPEEGRKTAGIIMTIVGAVVALTAAIIAMNTAISWGTMLPVLMAGVGVAIAGASAWAGQLESTANSVQVRKSGGMIEDGLFTMNKGEIMGTFDDGTSIVANNQQIISGIEQGVYKAVRSAMSNGSGGDVVIQIDSRELARATASANASALSNKYRVDFKPR